MKVKPEHYKYIKSKCQEVVNKYPLAWSGYKEHGRSPERFRWDVARAACLMPFFCETIYKYANDAHINTALKKAIPLDVED